MLVSGGIKCLRVGMKLAMSGGAMSGGKYGGHGYGDDGGGVWR